MTGTTTAKKKGSTDDENKKLGQLLTKAQRGDTKALEELRPLLDEAELWGHLNDLGRRVQDS